MKFRIYGGDMTLIKCACPSECHVLRRFLDESLIEHKESEVSNAVVLSLRSNLTSVRHICDGVNRLMEAA